MFWAQLAGVVEYTNYISTEGLDTTNLCPGYDVKPSDGDACLFAMLELWGMWSISSLPLLPGPFWSRVVPPDSVLSMGQIELNCITWNRTVLC